MATVSPKQLSFIENLHTQCELPFTDEHRALVEGLDTKSASAYIDTLKTYRSQLPRQAARGVLPPEGIHYLGDEVYRVRVSQTGNMYATKFTLTLNGSYDWEYVGRRPLPQLSESTLMTREQAQAFGKAFGVCVRCAALLTDTKVNGSDGLSSVERGMGPVCFKRWGM